MIPALAFNVWALGSPFEFAYGAAVDSPGFSGHDTLGLNDDGFFGITAPRLDAAVDLLVANRGPAGPDPGDRGRRRRRRA